MSRKTSLEIIHVTLMTPMTTVAKRFSAEKTILKISILDFLLWVFMCVQSNHPEDDKKLDFLLTMTRTMTPRREA